MAGAAPSACFLEFHHREPYAIGGEATVANISLRCRAHNVYEAELAFGRGVPAMPSSAAPVVRETPVTFGARIVGAGATLQPGGKENELAPGRVAAGGATLI